MPHQCGYHNVSSLLPFCWEHNILHTKFNILFDFVRRASVHVRLVKLGKLPGFFELVHRLKLEARGKYGETDRQYTGVFDISNAERLGKSEVHLINIMVEGVAKLIEIERQLENGETVNIDEIAKSI